GIVRERDGNTIPTAAPIDNFPTSDGKFVCIVGSSDANFGRLCRAMGRTDLLEDPLWATPATRAEGADQINAIVAAWTSEHSAEEIERLCIEHDVPVGTAYSVVDILADPHMAERGDVVTVEDTVIGPIRQ